MINMLELEKAIIDAKNKYGNVYSITIGEDVFVWRLLTQKEYEIINKSCSGDKYIKEEMICQYVTVYPKDILYSTYKAGIATQLSKHILQESGFSDNGKAYHFLDACREDNDRNFITQAHIVVASAFPQYKFEEIESWDIEQLIDMVSKAEWKLNVIDNKPFRFEKIESLDDENEQDTKEESLHILEQELIELGGDPVLMLYDRFYKKEKPYYDMPFILGRWWNREDVVDATREGIQKRKRINH